MPVRVGAAAHAGIVLRVVTGCPCNAFGGCCQGRLGTREAPGGVLD
jgi:hypothetical protein